MSDTTIFRKHSGRVRAHKLLDLLEDVGRVLTGCCLENSEHCVNITPGHKDMMATTCQRHAKTIAIQAPFVLRKRFQDRCACFLQLPEGQVGESQEVLYQSGLASNWSLEFS